MSEDQPELDTSQLEISLPPGTCSPVAFRVWGLRFREAPTKGPTPSTLNLKPAQL